MKKILLFVSLFIAVYIPTVDLYAADVDYYYEKQSTAAVTYRYESTPGAPTFDADTLDGHDSTYFLRASSGAQIDINTAEITQINIDTATNRTSIDTNTGEITQINIDTATNRTDIDTNTGEITQINIDTATNRTDIDTNTGEITDLKVSTPALQSQVDLLETNTGYLETTTSLLKTNTGYLETATTLLETNTGYLETTDKNIASSTGPLVYQSYNPTMFRNETSTDVYTNGYSSATEHYGGGSNLTGIATGGKAVIWLLPGSAKLPNSAFARLEKVTRTNGVDNVLKFDAAAAGTDETAYYQTVVPDFYGGDDLTVSVYSVINTTESAALLAEVNIEARTVAHDGAWNAAYTAIITIEVNPTGTAEDMLIDTGAWDVDGTLQLVAGQPLSIKVWVDCSDSTFVSFDAEEVMVAIKIEED